MSVKSGLRTLLRGKQTEEAPLPQPLPSHDIKGSLDTLDNTGWVTGWVFNNASADERLQVEILADGIPVADTVADLFRPDLQQAGIGDGRHGFECMLPDALLDGSIHSIEVREAATGTVLPGLPDSAGTFQGVLAGRRVAAQSTYMNAALAPGSTSGYCGFIDSITEEGIRGWVLDTENSNEPLTVSIFLAGELIGTASSGESRADIASILGLPVHPGLYFNWQNAKLPAPDKERDQEAAQLTFVLEANGLQLRIRAQPKTAEVYFWVASAQTIATMAQQLTVKDEELHRLQATIEHLRKQLEEKNNLLARHQADLTRVRQEVAFQASWKAELQKDVQRFKQIIQSA